VRVGYLVDARLADGQPQVFIRDGKEWRPVHGLARDETLRAFVSGQIIVESEAGIAGYSLTQFVAAP
jgi:hypothetical protein